jgi:hypothetical protein
MLPPVMFSAKGFKVLHGVRSALALEDDVVGNCSGGNPFPAFYTTSTVSSPNQLVKGGKPFALEPYGLVLGYGVEGHQHTSSSSQYLTASSWVDASIRVSSEHIGHRKRNRFLPLLHHETIVG